MKCKYISSSFSFFCLSNRTQISADELCMPTFCRFCLKIDSHNDFDPFCVILRKNGKHHSILCYKSKYTDKFHAFLIKTDFKNEWESLKLDGEKNVKLIQDVHFVIFPSINHYHKKNEKDCLVFYKHSTKIKQISSMTSKMRQKTASLELRIVLREWQCNYT